MTDVAKHIVAGYQQIVNSFKQTVSDQPGRLRWPADKALFNRGAVKMPEHRQRSIVVDAVTVPDDIQ